MKKIIIDKIEEAIVRLQDSNDWPRFDIPKFDVNYPQHKDHGDFAVNVSMVIARHVKKTPMEVGNDIKSTIDMEGIDRVDVVQPGFINLFVNETFLSGGVKYILEKSSEYGKNKSGIVNDTPRKVLVEFLSANPTGPLHLGNGRGGFTGDVMARILRASGYDVISEYYVNDFGNQVEVLAESVLRRYLQNQGIKIDYPEELYKGDYIKELADKIELKDIQLGSQDAMQKIREEVKAWSMQQMIEQIKEFTENTLRIHYDVWKSEKSLHTKKNIDQALNFLRDNNLIYEKDGATFFASMQYGDDKDRVIIKSTGEHTYFFSDIMYLIDKFVDRKIDHWIWYLGADHHGYKGRMEAALKAIGHDGKMDIIFVQLVRLMFNGKELRMSKRKGTFITLDELIEEVGIDVARWFFLMHDANTHMDFDLNLAREQSDKNPVYYVQYAHARICSILKNIPEAPSGSIRFTSAAEEVLAKALFKFPEIVEEISTTHHVHKLPTYTLEVARAFHKFYAANRVIDEDVVNMSRVQLVQATKIVLENSLEMMGIAAPEKM